MRYLATTLVFLVGTILGAQTTVLILKGAIGQSTAFVVVAAIWLIASVAVLSWAAQISRLTASPLATGLLLTGIVQVGTLLVLSITRPDIVSAQGAGIAAAVAMTTLLLRYVPGFRKNAALQA